jgi:hypothetical protein
VPDNLLSNLLGDIDIHGSKKLPGIIRAVPIEDLAASTTLVLWIRAQRVPTMVSSGAFRSSLHQ